MRAFIALKIPTLIITAVHGIQQRLAGYRFNVRWVKAKNIHLTLKFIGSVDAHLIDSISTCVAEATDGITPFQLTAKGIGVFPKIERARVIWVGLSGQVTALNALQKSIDIKLAGFGFPREKRKFKGHLTLGRSKGALDTVDLARAIEEFKNFKSETFLVDRVSLFRSDLNPSGAVHTELREILISQDQMHYK
jgi:2'-5' RNA ligase